MPNFVDTEAAPPRPVREREPLCKWSDGTAINHYYHRSKTDSVTDICKPGHFDFMRETFRSGGMLGVVHYVTCLLGRIEDGLTRVDLHLVAAPLPSGGPVVMAVSTDGIKHFKPVAHDGVMATTGKPKRGEAA